MQPFLLSERFITLAVGPYGSSKTTAGIMKIAYHASRMAPSPDGIRRSRAIWIRQTIEQLKDTSIKDFLKWFPDGVWGSYAKTERVFYMKFGDVECEVLFRSLDDANDVRRLLSLQASFAIMDEFREIHPDIYHAVQGRLGRYPDRSVNGLGCVVDEPAERCQHCWELLPKGFTAELIDKGQGSFKCPSCGKRASAYLSNAKLWGMTNPPDEGTFWGDLLLDPPPNVKVVWQPSGLSPEADWLEYLPDGYYEQLCQGKSQEWIDVYVHGKLGKGLFGRPVHRQFSRERHVAEVERVPGVPLVIGADAGLHPACVIGQITSEGRLVILDELYDECAAYQFVHDRLIPLLRERYPRVPVSAVIIDPAAFQRSQTDARTVAQVYEAAGFDVQPGRTNSLSERIGALDDLMTRTLRDGKAALQIHPRCRTLIDALSHKYAYKKLTNGSFKAIPEKNHPHSDLCFATGTPVLTPRGFVPIETLRVGDPVLTHKGVRKVVATGRRRVDRTLCVTLSTGDRLVCTVDHPFIKVDGEVVPAYLLHVGDELEAVWQRHRWFAVYAELAARSSRRLRGVSGRVRDAIAASLARVRGRASMVWRSMGCGFPRTFAPATTIASWTGGPCLFTDTCTRSTGERSLRGIAYTTRITTEKTTTSTTSYASRLRSMRNTICSSVSRVVSWTPRGPSVWRRRVPRRGIGPRKGGSGIESTRKRSRPSGMLPVIVARWSVRGVAKPIWGSLICARRAFVRLLVRVPRGGRVAWMTRTAHALSAVPRFVPTNTPKPRRALKVVGLNYCGAADVFNLTVDDAHTYYAGPALVHNCDSLHYLGMEAQVPGSYAMFGRGFRREEPVRVLPSPVRVF